MIRRRRQLSVTSRSPLVCPGCGGAIFWALYIPAPPRLDPTQPRKPLPLDAAPSHLGNPLVSHAASTGRTTCRLITAENPLLSYETAHSLHYATHPDCRVALLSALTRRTR